MSYTMWCDVIKWGCDASYRVYDVIHIVGVMSCIQKCLMSLKEWVWWHRYSGWHVIYNGYDVVNYSRCDLINRVGVLSSKQWMWWHRYNGHDVKYSGCDVLKMVLWGHKVRMWCLVECKQCHTYGECDVIQRVGVMLSIQWVWGHR